MARQAQAQPNRGGRPTKRESAAIQKAICRNIANGNTLEVSARLAGITYRTLARWRNLSVTFCQAVEKAEAEAEALHVGAIVNAGVGGNWQASAWWLERRRHGDWRKAPEQLRVGGDPDNPAPLVVERVVFKGE